MWHFHPKGLLLSEQQRFLWTRPFRWLSQPNDTRFSQSAQGSLHVQGDTGAVSSSFPSRSSFVFTSLVFYFLLYNSLTVSTSRFLHLCSGFCDCVGKLCLFCSLQLSMVFCEKHLLPSTTVYEICRNSSKKLMFWLLFVTLTREANSIWDRVGNKDQPKDCA